MLPFRIKEKIHNKAVYDVSGGVCVWGWRSGVGNLSASGGGANDLTWGGGGVGGSYDVTID